jgi:hypothetical protein
MILQMRCSIRSERQLVERIVFDILFRWFGGFSMDGWVFDASSFSKNCARLLNVEIAWAFLGSLVASSQVRPLMSAEHFSVDGIVLKLIGTVQYVTVISAFSKLGTVCRSGVPDDVRHSLDYAISQRLRNRIDEIFGWGKTTGGLTQSKRAGSKRCAPSVSLLAWSIMQSACKNCSRPRAKCVPLPEKWKRISANPRRMTARRPFHVENHRPPLKSASALRCSAAC